MAPHRGARPAASAECVDRPFGHLLLGPDHDAVVDEAGEQRTDDRSVDVDPEVRELRADDRGAEPPRRVKAVARYRPDGHDTEARRYHAAQTGSITMYPRGQPE